MNVHSSFIVIVGKSEWKVSFFCILLPDLFHTRKIDVFKKNLKSNWSNQNVLNYLREVLFSKHHIRWYFIYPLDYNSVRPLF